MAYITHVLFTYNFNVMFIIFEIIIFIKEEFFQKMKILEIFLMKLVLLIQDKLNNIDYTITNIILLWSCLANNC